MAARNADAVADLALDKSGPETGSAGGTLTYTVSVSNAGPSDAEDVSVEDLLPAGLIYGGGSAECSQAGGLVTCDIGAHHTRAWTIAKEVEQGKNWTDEDRVNLVIVSDHGMSQTSLDRVVVLDDYISLEDVRVVEYLDALLSGGGFKPRRGPPSRNC